MKKILLFLFLLACIPITAQTTYYYKLIKKVKGGNTDLNVSGGQFITFTSKACYESDKNGYSVNHGKLDYKYSESGIKTYVGDSYWGSHTIFLFKTDLSGLNVKTSDDMIYVYKRANAPSGVITCSLIRKKSEEGYVSPTYPVLPTYPQSGYAGSGSYNGGQSGNTGSSTYRPERDKPQKTRHTCPGCNGAGSIVRNDGSISSYGNSGYMKRCSTCGAEYWSTTFHRHETCRICHGRGYQEY